MTEQAVSARPQAALGARALGSFMRRHGALLALLAAGAALRVVALVAIYPGIWFPDTNNYVRQVALQTLSVTRVGGYALAIAPFFHLGSAGALIIAQHVIGLGIGVAIYALLVHRGVPRPVALLAIVPAALDAYLIDIEHMIMSETVFHATVVGAIVVLLWKDEPGPVATGAAGLLLGYAAIVRSVALPFVAIFVVYLLVRRVGWRPLVLFCAGWAVVTGAYVTVYHAQHGKYAFTQFGGRFLYAQVAPFADCAQLAGLPADERPLCPDPRHRLTTNAYLWGHHSPIHGLPVLADARIGDFAMRVVRADPGRYLQMAGGDFAHFFAPGHPMGRNDYPVDTWQFPADPARWDGEGYRGPIRPGSAIRHPRTLPSQYINPMAGTPRTNTKASRFLHDYQRHAYTSGVLLAACALLVLVALFRRRRGWRLRLDAGLLAASALAALAMASALSVFDYRYGLVAVVLLPPAAAMAGTAIAQRPAPGGTPVCR
jgi:hypothetical protein